VIIIERTVGEFGAESFTEYRERTFSQLHNAKREAERIFNESPHRGEKGHSIHIVTPDEEELAVLRNGRWWYPKS
jgi:hypothetical protein